jgi:quinol-cytochrome oxidoreductase complex cytochrome b subunit
VSAAAGDEGVLQTLGRVLRSPVPPERARRLAFGWSALALFLVLGTTGALLSIYYLPAPEAANESVRFVVREVAFGWLVRGLHRWGATLLLACAAAQLVRVFLTGSYRGGRAGSWVLGLVLLLLVVGLAFTGELLPWDARSARLAAAALAGTEAIPVAGPALAHWMRGGPEIGVATLARANAAHVLILPWLAFLVLALSLWLLARGRGREDA